ncbi:MAG: class II aldolase/adducin family protein [Anaerolineae bacterium]
MRDTTDLLNELVAMSHWLGDPARDLVILGEGNTSARVDEHSFFVKASGMTLREIEPDGFVEIAFAPMLEFLDHGDPSDEATTEALMAARVDPTVPFGQAQDKPLRPSVETPLHALALVVGGAKFVGHTHPTAVNAILCSRRAEEAIAGRLFPDEIVVCGPAPAYVPYTDPGLPLARKVWEVLETHIETYGEPPKVILMQNHGLIALGQSPREVQNITAMYVKTARILLGAYALGGPRFMTPDDVARIHTRPDEAYRRRELVHHGGNPSVVTGQAPVE